MIDKNVILQMSRFHYSANSYMSDTADCLPDYFTIGISSRHDDLNVDEHENLQVYTVGGVK